MRIEGNYRGRGRWYPGKIVRIRANGTYDINYDDGERELGIDINNIKVTDEELFLVVCDKCYNKQQIPSSKPNYVLCNMCRTRIKTPYAPRETVEEVEEKKRKEEEEKLENMHKTEFNRNLDDVEKKTIKKDTLMRLIRSFDYNIDKPLSVDEKNIADKTIKNQYFYDYVRELGDNIPFIEYFYIIKHLEKNYKSNSKKLLDAAQKNIETQIMQKQEEYRLQQIEQEMRNKQRNIDTLNQDINIKRKEEELKNEEQLNQYFVDMHLEQRKKEEKLREAENEIEIERRFLRIKEQKKDLYFQTKMLDYDDEMDLYDINTFNRYSSCCNYFCKQTIIDDFDKIYELIINLPSLTTYEKNLILIRFKAILTYCEKNYNVVSKLYNISRMILMTCSIVNPALLSINNDANNPNYIIIYWVVWCSQILVSLITGYTGIFKWDKKNLIFNAYKTKINQEIWLYIELSGTNYKKINNSEEYSEYGECNHAIYLNKFLTRLEMFYTQLKCSELEIEAKKDDDKGTGSNVGVGGNSRDEVRKAQDILKSRAAIRR
jgi:ribosomal protein S27E